MQVEIDYYYSLEVWQPDFLIFLKQPTDFDPEQPRDVMEKKFAESTL